MKTITFSDPGLTDEFCKPIILNLPAHYEVCWQCQGEGHHVRRDIDDSKLVDNMMEDGDDEGIEAYYKGAYDVQCTLCHGQRVILVPNSIPEWAQKKINEYNHEMAEYRRECEAERRVGA